MGDKAALAKARQELEDLYLGVPDDSVDLTFKDLASFQQEAPAGRKASNMEPIHEELVESLKKSPGPGKSSKRDARLANSLRLDPGLADSSSLDFAKSLQEAREKHRRLEDELYGDQQPPRSSPRRNKELKNMVENSQLYDDTNALGMAVPFEERGGSKRLGIPHINFCALCSKYIRFFQHRCLVCGRVYCRNCVGKGMGEMTEGRKCIPCLGRRFSQRYIHRAGQTGCCWMYSSSVKQQELIWAEKGPRRSVERQYGRSSVSSRSRSLVVMPRTPTSPHLSRSRSPVMPGTPTRRHASQPRSPVMPGTPTRSFVSNSPVVSSAFSPERHGFPTFGRPL